MKPIIYEVPGLLAMVRYARSRPGRRTTARLKFWKGLPRRAAKSRCTEMPQLDPCDYMPGRSPSPIRRHSRGSRGSSFFRSWIASQAHNHDKPQLTRNGPHARSECPPKLAPIIVHAMNTKKETSDITSAANFHGPRPFHRATIVGDGSLQVSRCGDSDQAETECRRCTVAQPARS
jgi:hypothetical protein